MKLNPAGYYVRVSIEDVDSKIQDGALKGFIMEKPEDDKRLQDGHDVGILEAVGPTSFTGMNGIDEDLSPEQRAEQWGVKIGELVQFNRYDGKVPRHEEEGNYRIIQDQHLIGVYSDE